jgi:recombination endonuclease VII
VYHGGMQCSMWGCKKPVHAKGLCQPHYRQMRRRERGLKSPGQKKQTVCKNGGHELTEENLMIDSSGHRRCRICRQEQIKRYDKKARYGLTPEDFIRILLEQDGKCAICSREFSKALTYSVDHDHACCPGEFTCGKCVRALICRRCNTMIGLAGDSISILESAIEYLVKHKDK